MDDKDIEIINQGQKTDKIIEILQKFMKDNENVFTFPTLSQNNKREILWATLFQHLQDKSLGSLHPVIMAVIRVLSRDKAGLETLICEKWITILIEKAGLYNFVGLDEESNLPIDMPEKDDTVEALKCLCNITFNSEVARALCATTSIAQGLISRLRLYKDIKFKDDIMLYDMKLLFILTALRHDIKIKIKDELHGMHYLTSCLKELLFEASKIDDVGAVASSGLVEGDQHCVLNGNQQAIVCEILKAQFNLILRPGSEESIDDAEEDTYLKLIPVLAALLNVTCSTDIKTMELYSNIANLLTSVPPTYYEGLTPLLTENETARNIYEDRNMDALQSLVDLLQFRLAQTIGSANQYESLSPVLTVLNKSSRGCRWQRKYLRQVVLPPLRDVTTRPEKGDTLRNQLCRLLTTPVTSLRDLVAEFLFVLCKEKVGRMVKYTGFGNAAGLLAQKGLLGGDSNAGGRYSSSSEDSDTDEYRHAAPHIDPVVGCTRPPRNNPFEGMSEEQKEYEAMKLVNMFDKLMSEGIVKPARVGPDGRPQALDHVLEMRENLPNRPQS